MAVINNPTDLRPNVHNYTPNNENGHIHYVQTVSSHNDVQKNTETQPMWYRYTITLLGLTRLVHM